MLALVHLNDYADSVVGLVNESPRYVGRSWLFSLVGVGVDASGAENSLIKGLREERRKEMFGEQDLVTPTDEIDQNYHSRAFAAHTNNHRVHGRRTMNKIEQNSSTSIGVCYTRRKVSGTP